jgi:RHS repeat-associated protein
MLKSRGYNLYGELATQTDARGIVTTMGYDLLGRLTGKNSPLASRRWVYDHSSVGKGQLYQASGGGQTQTHSYDSLGRIKQTLTQIGGASFTEKFAYDGVFGRLKAMSFPSGEHLAYRFDDNGYLIEDYQLYSNGTEKVLRRVDDYSAFGSINRQTFGNGKVQQFFRNSAGAPMSICTGNGSGCNVIGVQYLNYDYDAMGNLESQDNVISQFREDYRYDALMRVDDATKTIRGVRYASVDYDYDAAGNIKIKSDYGSGYQYGNSGKSLGGKAGPNALRQFIRGGVQNFSYDDNGNRLSGDGATLSYDDENKPLSVSRNGVVSSFSYGADGKRFKQVKTQGSTVTTTYYVGSFDREVSVNGTIDKTYLGDHTLKMKAQVGSLGNQAPLQHLLRDRLGSVDTLMDGNTGAVLQYRGYDVFGRPRDIAAGNALLTSWQGVTKGYTDHEHLNEQQLIHMNGRIYDFNVGRFLSVDPFLQFPENSQSANPYSYILNNPMSGTDPSGYASCSLDDDASCLDQDAKNIDIKDKSGNKIGTYTKNGEKNTEKGTEERFTLSLVGKQNSTAANQSAKDGGTNQSESTPATMSLAASALGVTQASSIAVTGAAIGLGEWLAVGMRSLMGGGMLATVLSIPGDSAVDKDNQYLYVTYTRVNPKTGQVYAGRTGGYGTPEELVHRRSLGQPLLKAEGFRSPTVDQWSTNRAAIRGREQQLIDFYGGAKSVGGSARNMINGVADFNLNRPIYMGAARAEFGNLQDNSPQRRRWEGF